MPPSIFQIDPAVFFRRDGLNEAQNARLDRSVAQARDTLALADRLQSMRDVRRSLDGIVDFLKGHRTHISLGRFIIKI